MTDTLNAAQLRERAALYDSVADGLLAGTPTVRFRSKAKEYRERALSLEAADRRESGKVERHTFKAAPDNEFCEVCRNTISHLSHFVAAPTAHPATTAWEPIETAPKDGTNIWGLTTHGSIVFCRWITENDRDSDHGTDEWGNANVRFHLVKWARCQLPAPPAPSPAKPTQTAEHFALVSRDHLKVILDSYTACTDEQSLSKRLLREALAKP